jgi:hypothetical protein
MPQGFEILAVDNEGNPLVDNEGDYVYFGAITEPILPLALQEAFNLPGAAGTQLENVGTYVGGARTNNLLNGTAYTLSDAQFTEYLQLLALRNSLPSDLGDIETFLYDNFTVEGTQVLSMFDFADMHVSFTYTALRGTYPIFEAFITRGNLPKPMGVGGSFIYNPTSLTFFAFRTYNQAAQPNTTGFNTYSGSQQGTYLQYANGITILF